MKKWKTKTYNVQQLILNLNQQILHLQNNNSLITTMVGYPPPQFHGTAGEDPEDFINEWKRYVLASRINVVPGAGEAAGRAEIDGLYETCLLDDAKIWYINEIKDRNY